MNKRTRTTNWIYFAFWLMVGAMVFIPLAILGTLIGFFGNQPTFWIILLSVHVVSILLVGWHLAVWDFYGEYKFFWMLVLVSFPLLSLWAYFFFGNLKRLRLYQRSSDARTVQPPAEKQQKDLKAAHKNINQLPARVQNLFHYASAITGRSATANTDFTLFTAPFDKFKQMAADLRAAKRYIHLNYFIIQQSDCFAFIYEILLQKLKEKIEVKIIYDYVGTIFNSRPAQLKELAKRGAKIHAFGKIWPFDINLVYIDHRKDLIIDDRIAYTGGYNIGDEYCHMSASYGYWQDAHLRLEGRAAEQLEVIFGREWNAETKTKSLPIKLPEARYVPHLTNLTHVVASSRPERVSVMRNLILEAFAIAQRKIWIMSPFLVIDEEMMQTLIRAAQKNIDVRLILTKNSTKWFVQLMRLRFDELIDAGVKIYEFHGYSHSKITLIDDDVVLVGTVNLDYHSFYWASQTVFLIYERAIARQIEQAAFVRDFQFADLLQASPLKKRNVFYRWKVKLTSVIRLFV